PFDRGGLRTGEGDALVLRHLPPALAWYPLPAKKGNHPGRRRYTASTAAPESPARGVGSGQVAHRDSPHAGHTKQEPRPVFRCGDGALLRGHVSRVEAGQQDPGREDGEDVADGNRVHPAGRRRLPIALQRMPHVLPSGDLSVLARDLAGEGFRPVGFTHPDAGQARRRPGAFLGSVISQWSAGDNWLVRWFRGG